MTRFPVRKFVILRDHTSIIPIPIRLNKNYGIDKPTKVASFRLILNRHLKEEL